MKLHNLLLSAALFLSAGLVFAEETISEEDYHDSTFDFVSNNNAYYWQTSGNNMLTVTLIQYKGDAEDESGWTYYAVGYDSNGAVWEESLTLSNSSITGRALTSEEAAALPKYRNGDFDAYQFEIPFNDEAVEKIGLKGRNGSDNQTVYSADNSQATNKTHFTESGTETILFFGKNKFQNGNIAAVIAVGASYAESDNGGGEGTMGAPLPAPIVTLLIALGFGAALVMYRNRKQNA